MLQDIKPIGNMKTIILLSICAAALAYNDVPDIDVDSVVKDPVETRKYLDCFLDKGPCTDPMNKIKGKYMFLNRAHSIDLVV